MTKHETQQEPPLADGSGVAADHYFDGPPGDSGTIAPDMSGVFYCGDNREILDELRLIPDESIDLIYLDPPFNSRRNYNLVYKDSRAQELAFKDYWTWEEAAQTYATIVDSPGTPRRLRALLRGLHELLKDDDADLLAYLSMMSPRLVAMHRVLRSSGSLYLHCDPTAGHYLKTVLDAIFGAGNFRTEIVWKRSAAHSDTKQGRASHGRIHDVILFYTKGDEWTWNPIHLPYERDYVESKYRHIEPETGRRFRKDNLTAAKPGGDTSYEWKGVRPYTGRYWAYSKEKMEQFDREGRLAYTRTGMPEYKRYLDEMPGVPLQDVWIDIDPINSQAAERLGYPTQKPLTLLARIIGSSTKEGDVVLDPFCGCGTTVEACERMGRRWIGIDISHKAVEVTQSRFAKLELDEPAIEWVPPDMDAAKALAAQSGKKFETWVLRKIRAVRYRKRDRGIDGEAFFKDAAGVTQAHVLVSVKSGGVQPRDVRELRGTIEREGSTLGAFVSLQEPSREMRREAVEAGFWRAPDGTQFPRIQFLTVQQIFDGARIVAPGENVTTLPPPTVPAGIPKKYEQLSLRLDPTKPVAKSYPPSAKKQRTG